MTKGNKVEWGYVYTVCNGDGEVMAIAAMSMEEALALWRLEFGDMYTDPERIESSSEVVRVIIGAKE